MGGNRNVAHSTSAAFDSSDGSDATVPYRADENGRAQTLPQLAKGSSLGRYIVLDCIGSGGMGVVYKAYDPKLSREVALKLIAHSDDSSNCERRGPSNVESRLYREARAMAQLSHPNVVPVFDIESTEHGIFLAMEFVPGQDVKRWLGESPPSWQEVLGVFIDAGRGLAAAHNRGLVHRDFKPSNVLIDTRDRRVRVTDFGLAKHKDDVERDREIRSAPISDTTWDTELTEDGFVLGTPAYMAPEVVDGESANALSDQFSFFVALYEGLSGHRPRAGRPEPASGRPPVEPLFEGPADVPAWLQRVVVRGLHRDPNKRWPTMDAALRALQNDPHRRRKTWQWRVGIGTASLFIAGLFYSAGTQTTAPMCQRDASLLSKVWDDERRARLATAFGDLDLDFASSTWSIVARRLDEYAGAWLDGQLDACEATHVRGVQSEQLLDRRIACLEQHKREFAATVDLLESNTAKFTGHAVEMVTKLDRVEHCNDPAYLMADIPLPDRPAERETLAQLRERIARVGALEHAGQLGEGIAMADRLMDDVLSLDYAPLTAELLYRRGELERLGGNKDRAVELLTDAYFTGFDAKNYRVAADAATALIFSHGYLLQDPRAGLQWSRHAAAAQKLSGRDPMGTAAIEHWTGVAHAVAKSYAQAEDCLQRALAIRAKVAGWDHLEVGSTYVTLGWLAWLQDRQEDALYYRMHALDNWELSRGEHNPRLLRALLNVLSSLRTLGRDDEAVEYADWAADLLDNPSVAIGDTAAHTYKSIGEIWERLGDHARALDCYVRSVDIYRVALGTHPQLAEALEDLGRLHRRQGRTAAAVAILEEAVAMYAQFDTTTEAAHAAAQFELGQSLWDAGFDRDRAVLLARDAYAIQYRHNRHDATAAIENWFADHALGPP